MKYLKVIFIWMIKLWGFFLKRESGNLFCIPNRLCALEPVDIFNYTAENVVCFTNYIVNHCEDESIKIYLVCFDEHRYLEYLNLARNLTNIELVIVQSYESCTGRKWVKLKTIYNYYRCFFQAKFIISGSVMEEFPLKLHAQINICINYYTPFKSDLQHSGTNDKVDYVVSTSLLASQIDSIASHVNFKKYIVLGYPKLDNIIHPRFTKEEVFSKLKLGSDIHKIMLYTPTHRDYERDKKQKRNILGFEGDYTSLNRILQEQSTMLIIRLHPGQNKGCLEFENYSNIKLFVLSYEYTLYDILPYTDLLLSDYTSMYFDFMLTNKPVIFNFFDKDIYEKTRGFSYNPIENICAGKIVYCKKQLEETIKYKLEKNDIYQEAEKYNWVKNMLITQTDGNASQRIYEFIQSLRENK